LQIFEIQISERKDYGRSKVPICPNISIKWKIISAETAQNEPNLHKSCAPCQKTKTRKLRKSCAPQHCSFLVGLIVTSELWKCGVNTQQTTNLAVDKCPSTKFDVRLLRLQKAVDDIVCWLKTMVTKAITK